MRSGDTPRRTAGAYAVGVFFGFCPIMGLHTVLGLAAAFSLGLNRVAVLLGVYSNLPWVVGPWYAGTTVAGAALLGTELPPEFGNRLRGVMALSLLRGDFWRQLSALMEPLVWPFVVGSTIGSVALAGAAYWAALALINARQRHVARRRELRLARAATERRAADGARPSVRTPLAEPRADRHVS